MSLRASRGSLPLKGEITHLHCVRRKCHHYVVRNTNGYPLRYDRLLKDFLEAAYSLRHKN